MKFVIVAVFIAFMFVLGVDSGFVHNVTNETLVINATVDVRTNVQLHVPIEEIWAGLSKGHRYPIINSGDTIALRLAYTYGSFSQYWLYCATTCYWTNRGSPIITASGWSSWTNSMKFVITAFGKVNGEPIDSGDTVSLSSVGYGSTYRLRCTSSSSWRCRVQSLTSSMTGHEWLYYSYATFQIYSGYATEGTPVQYGDVVGFKYPYYYNSAWLSYYSGCVYPRGCSSNRKYYCAAENKYTGFQIFKKL